MYKINIKESILEIVEKNNLEILKIDLMNDEESFVRSYSKERNEFCKAYTTLEDLDFEVESIFMHDEVRGAIQCRDKTRFKTNSECVKLLKGSIKKLIGKELSWEDEPVELK